ncbi:MAG TPA: hypothetical protein VGD58_25905 [Herpetosiphonaceae bacterium]
MQQVAGFPYFEVQFNKDGAIVSQSEVTQIVDFAGQGTISDLLVIAHGWNNDMDDARGFYKHFFSFVRQQLDQATLPGLAGRSFAILGVLWPSKKFAEKDLTPGGAASTAGAISNKLIQDQLANLKGTFDAPKADTILSDAQALVPKLESSPAARAEFAALLRQLMPSSPAQEGEVPQQFFKLSDKTLMERLAKPPRIDGAAHTVGGGAALGAAGHAAGNTGFGEMLTGVKAAALNLLNFVTYYQMKDRAGVVGQQGLYQVLRKLREKRPDLKLHLMGHSFGCRLLSAAVNGPDNQPAIQVSSMTMLQAAFSHNGFAERFDGKHNGFFRRVVAEHRVKGPILISHTPNDTAVGMAYPIASRLVGQNASGLGDKNDPFGGMGRNGAQKTPEAIDGTLLDAGGAYSFQAGKVYNLSADEWIKGHSDISSKQVAYAMLAGVAAS